MFAEINARLVAIQGELRKKDKYEVQLADYQRELETIKETIAQLKASLKQRRRTLTSSNISVWQT